MFYNFRDQYTLSGVGFAQSFASFSKTSFRKSDISKDGDTVLKLTRTGKFTTCMSTGFHMYNNSHYSMFIVVTATVAKVWLIQV